MEFCESLSFLQAKMLTYMRLKDCMSSTTIPALMASGKMLGSSVSVLCIIIEGRRLLKSWVLL